MEALYHSHQKKHLEILAVSIDTAQAQEKVRSYVEDFGFQFPILLDPRLDANQLYQIRVVPSSFLIDKKGILRHIILGARDWTDPEAYEMITKLINEKG